MEHPLVQIIGDPSDFLDSIINELSGHEIDVANLFMDHICFRVESTEEYGKLKQELIAIGQLLSDKMIGERPIAVIELKNPFHYRNRSISVIELPSPKEGRPYPTGYEHVEFVTKGSLESFISDHPNITFDHGGMKKSLNRDLRISLDAGAVKFHELSLKKVIEIEES